MRALVVDDNQSVRTFVARVLRDAGYETETAMDGVAAQHLVLKHGAPDLVVTDESMPRMSGHEFAHWVRTSFQDVKVLFLTGYVDHAARASASLSQGVRYVEKPCSVRDLLEAVAALTAENRKHFSSFVSTVSARP